MSRILLIAALSCLTVNVSSLAATSLEELMLATCRVERATARGSGCVFAESAESYYILTNYHVVGSASVETIQVRFFNNGADRLFAGRVVAVAYTPNQWADVAVIELPKSAVGELRLPVIPLLPDGETRVPETFERTTIWTCGCPGGKWPTLLEGRAIVEPSYQGAVKLHPSVEGGRSGSPVFSRLGGEFYITGLVGWRDRQDRFGIAMTIGQVKALLLSDRTVSTQAIPTHIERSNLETFESAVPVARVHDNCQRHFCRRPGNPAPPPPGSGRRLPFDPHTPPPDTNGPLNPWELWGQPTPPPPESAPQPPPSDSDLLARVAQLEAALQELRTQLRDLPAGPPGPVGPPGPTGPAGQDSDPAQLAELRTAIEQLQTRRRRVILTENGEIIDDETYTPDEPIVLEIRRIVRQE